MDLSGAAPGLEIQADVCIAGAGAAGVGLARSLAQRGHEVVLLEAGGMDFEQATQDLCIGSNTGMEYYELDHARLRFFGGTTNIWGGRCIPLDRIDFEQREWVPHSGWPISLEDLAPYYRLAHDSLELGDYDYSASLWQQLGLDPIDFRPAEISHLFWRFDAMEERFNSHQVDDLLAAENCRIMLHANVTNLQVKAETGRVTHVEARSLDGGSATISAAHFVLACGAIENARLLLISDDVVPAGVGNSNDQVGRYFMEHPHGRIAHIETRDPAGFWALYRKRFPKSGPPVAPALVASETLQREKGILNSAATFKIQRDPELGLAFGKKVYMNLKHDLSATRGNRRAWHLYRRLLNWLQRHASMSLLRPIARAGRMELYLMARAEQAPNPSSRVRLSEQRDALGARRGDLDWQLSDIDKRSALELARAVGREFERLGLGKLTPAEWLMDGGAQWPVDPTVGNHPIGGYHHMGTTRMSIDPGSGVVDADCTVHGHENLHIAGSSVFTTGGWANPTLTILALAHRLSDHLDRQLRK